MPTSSTDLEFHPAAMLLPLLGGDEYERLKADIAAHGQIEPIWLHPDGRILAGRYRVVETPTSIGFLLPVAEAEKYCLRRIDL